MRAAQPASCAPLNPRHALHKHHRQSKAPLPLPQTPRRRKTQPKHPPAPAREKGEPPRNAPRQRPFLHPHAPEKQPRKAPPPLPPKPRPTLRTGCGTHGWGGSTRIARPAQTPSQPKQRTSALIQTPRRRKKGDPQQHAKPARFFCAHTPHKPEKTIGEDAPAIATPILPCEQTATRTARGEGRRRGRKARQRRRLGRLKLHRAPRSTHAARPAQTPPAQKNAAGASASPRKKGEPQKTRPASALFLRPHNRLSKSLPA